MKYAVVDFQMARYKATIAYDGTDFAGFQRQTSDRTVQSVLEAVLGEIAGETRIAIRGAGRTDAGVHATGQVIDFDLPTWRRDPATLRHALNAMLPHDVAVWEIAPVADDFHARFAATSRAYIYTILNTPLRHPLYERTALHEAIRLDDGAMGMAVQLLLGEHDFGSFGRATTPSQSTVRTLLEAQVWREGELVKIGLAANGFLFRMVRSLVGTLLPIGRGNQPPEWILEVLHARHRKAAAKVIAPNGLCLVAVRYPDSPTGAAYF
jgi:tRNA pseudouridine38-40 synthase